MLPSWQIENGIQITVREYSGAVLLFFHHLAHSNGLAKNSLDQVKIVYEQFKWFNFSMHK